MRIAAQVRNAGPEHSVAVSTDDRVTPLAIEARAVGMGSSVNGGELLMLALATCYCNDLYREATRLGVELRGVEVEADADFEGPGLAATNIRYRARVESSAAQDVIARLLRETDAVAEVHNTLRSGTPVTMAPWSS